MPHDKFNRILNIGDEVVIKAKVSVVCSGDEYCNVTVITQEPMPPYKDGTAIVLNTRQVEKVGE